MDVKLRWKPPLAVLGVFLVVAVVCLAGSAQAQVQFPGPVAVDLGGDALSSISMSLEPGNPAYLVNGTGLGVLSLHLLNASGIAFLQLNQFLVGGQIVHMVPWEGRPLVNQGIVVATVNPDRLVFVQVLPQVPYFTIEDEVLLEEDPGTLAFIGNLVGGVPELAVSLPGVDQVVFLKQENGYWSVDSTQETGDQPLSILGPDLDGDQVRELVVANRGHLSGTLGVYRRDGQGDYIATQQDFPAGFPGQLAGFDFDEDGRMEIAATVSGSPEVVLLRDFEGQLVSYETIGLTLPADSVHLTRLYDGTAGLFAGNADRGLIDFFQLSQGAWIRRNSYYPGCHPLATASGDFNGDSGRDLISVGGDGAVVTVMFANPEPGFWGFPALALNASPGSSALADFDGDGLRDLAVSNGDLPLLSIFPGLPGGGLRITPTDIELSFYPGSITVINSDDDPGPELAILDPLGGNVFMADFVEGGGFSIVSEIPVGAGPTSISTDDVDRDGFFDLLVMTREVDEARVLFGAGDHNFPVMTTLGLENQASSMVALDVNDDGLPDLTLSDGVNRIWTALNLDGRSFGSLNWLNAGSGAGIMAVGDLDDDQDEDLIVVNASDASLSMFENNGTGILSRRIGAHTLDSAPSGIEIQDLDLDGMPDIVMNLREERVLGVAYAFRHWEYSVPAIYSSGPDVTAFNVDDFNDDEVPDILTLDRSLMLGLTLLNVEQELVAVAPEALTAACGAGYLEIRIEPDRAGPWTLAFGQPGDWRVLAASGRAEVGVLTYDRGVWILSVNHRDLQLPAASGMLRLTVGDSGRRESLDLPLEGMCPESPVPEIPHLAWAREPWPNPFNPLVNARFSLDRPAEVRAGIFDLGGRRIALLADGWFEAGEHPLRWDGKQGGRSVGAGVYLLRIVTPEKTLHRKIMLIK